MDPQQWHRPRRVGVQHVLFGLVAAAVAFTPLWGSAEAAPAGGLPCNLPTPFRREAFSNSTQINNQWLPLVAGSQFTLVGQASTDGGAQPHTVILTVTDLYKVIDGVRTVVLWDRDFQDGQLAEAELAFHAQDKLGNVWGLGEYPEEYENGRFSGAPNVWISGQDGAQGGIAMLGNPGPGTPMYLQGVAPKIDFLDCGQVFQPNRQLCVPAGCYDHVLVIDETSPLAGSAHQHKLYAPGVGNVQITAVNDPENETLSLQSAIHLDALGLTRAREAALKLDRHGFVVSPVYRHTEPAFTCPSATGASLLASQLTSGSWCITR
jgi:hypothetical protein